MNLLQKALVAIAKGQDLAPWNSIHMLHTIYNVLAAKKTIMGRNQRIF